MVVYESCDRFDHDLSICTSNYGKISMDRGCCIYYRSKSLRIWTINRFVPISIAYTPGMYFAQHDLPCENKRKIYGTECGRKTVVSDSIIDRFGSYHKMPTKCMDWMEISRFWDGFSSNVCDRNFIYLYIKWKWIVKGLGFLWKTFYEYFLDSFILQRCIFP